MRRKGDVSSIIHLRNLDLYNTYRRLTDNWNGPLVMNDVWQALVVSPSKRFWIEAPTALVAVKHMIKTGIAPSVSPAKKRQYQEIYRRVQLEQEQHPSDDLTRIVERVVLQPAPEFYITPFAAEMVINTFRSRRNG